MKRYVLLGAAGVWTFAALVGLVAGCTEAGIKPADQSVGIWTDPLTGCQYLNLYGRGITPRLDRGGKVICK